MDFTGNTTLFVLKRKHPRVLVPQTSCSSAGAGWRRPCRRRSLKHPPPPQPQPWHALPPHLPRSTAHCSPSATGTPAGWLDARAAALLAHPAGLPLILGLQAAACPSDTLRSRFRAHCPCSVSCGTRPRPPFGMHLSRRSRQQCRCLAQCVQRPQLRAPLQVCLHTSWGPCPEASGRL